MGELCEDERREERGAEGEELVGENKEVNSLGRQQGAGPGRRASGRGRKQVSEGGMTLGLLEEL